MKQALLLLVLSKVILLTAGLNLDYLDPTKLQTTSSPKVQQDTASQIIQKYTRNSSPYSNLVNVEVNPILFNDKKDVFSLRTFKQNGTLRIRASTGVAALWGFNYYLKKYCKSHIGWQVTNVNIPIPLPEVDEEVVSNDRFRYYQNVCTASYSFVWWQKDEWFSHIEWMALNGINLALAPVAQEAAWQRVYKRLGLTDDEIEEHFTGPAFLSWLRMGNVRGWGGPLPNSWFQTQRNLQDVVLQYMFQLGMIPIIPTFNGHVPKAFSRLYPNTTFYSIQTWNEFNSDYCCGLFLDPTDSLFNVIGKMFLDEIIIDSGKSHIYTADPFNEAQVEPWSTALVQATASAIFSIIKEKDDNGVWLLQNWMFVHDPVLWPKSRVKSFMTAVPNGRMLILDLQSEQWPQYYLYEMYYGQPFIWCMLHNFGGTLGMFGNMQSINKDVYEARSHINSTMIGVGLTPEGINQNYVVYDLMLESAWRKRPVENLNVWLANYAERRYGCTNTAMAWRYLLKSVYSFNGLNKMRGKYVITRRPSFNIKPWAWYRSKDLFKAFKLFILATDSCSTSGFLHDLVDVTRQALQYRAEQLYLNIDHTGGIYAFNASKNQFLDIMGDIESILATHQDFTANNWLTKARRFPGNATDIMLYEINARNQITLWGPNGEISDYACKQWAELFHYYYIPRWSAFLSAALDARIRNEYFDASNANRIIRSTVEEQFLYVTLYTIQPSPQYGTVNLAQYLYKKWADIPGLDDLPMRIIQRDPEMKTTLPDVDDYSNEKGDTPNVILLQSSTPTL